MRDDIVIRQMTRPEVENLVDWAAAEGWNPGLHDADIFWVTDPDAFVAAELGGDVIGGGAIASYGGTFGFMGFFIVRPEHRGRGFGDTLWHARRERLLGRLEPGSTIGMDGVFDMQSYYAEGGFVFSHRNLRFRLDGAINGNPSADATGEIVDLRDVDLAQVMAYDAQCFPAPRPAFLQRWIAQGGALALGLRQGRELTGYGVIRRCREGCKIGPLFADDPACAEALFTRLAEFADGDPVFLDAPENHRMAMDLVRRHGMAEVFGCARMYLGPVPSIAHDRVYGVTTFEFG